MSELLIVGGTGVISYAVVLEALSKGFKVSCINRGKSKSQKLPDTVSVYYADYRDEGKMKKILFNKHFDAVIDVLCFKESDIEYSVNLFKDVCKQYIFFSSCAVYNKGNGDYVCDESSPLVNSVWDYSVNKVACEKKLIELSSLFNLNYTIVRPAVTYGNTRIPYGITPKYGYHGTIIFRLLKNKPIILWDNGNALSTITRVEDFAVGLVGLIGNEKSYRQIFNVVGDEKYKWIEVIEILAQILGVTPSFVNLSKEELAEEMPYRKGEILGGRGISQLLDNSKLKSVVPYFKSNISLAEGLKKTVEYYHTHNYLQGIDYKFDAAWDRMAEKYSGGNLHYKFIDYMNNASIYDKLMYYTEKNIDYPCVKFMQRIIDKIHTLLKK